MRWLAQVNKDNKGGPRTKSSLGGTVRHLSHAGYRIYRYPEVLFHAITDATALSQGTTTPKASS